MAVSYALMCNKFWMKHDIYSSENTEQYFSYKSCTFESTGNSSVGPACVLHQHWTPADGSSQLPTDTPSISWYATYFTIKKLPPQVNNGLLGPSVLSTVERLSSMRDKTTKHFYMIQESVLSKVGGRPQNRESVLGGSIVYLKQLHTQFVGFSAREKSTIKHILPIPYVRQVFHNSS